jgi:cysteine desulfurase
VTVDRRWIYLDYAATTPLDPRVAEVMRQHIGGKGIHPSDLAGNPSSLHRAGRVARDAVERARAQVASLLSCVPESIVFTGSGTEADNLALKGALSGGPRHDARDQEQADRPDRGPRDAVPGPKHYRTRDTEPSAVHIVVSVIEHPAILETCRNLQRHGVDVSYLPVDAEGIAKVSALEPMLRPDTRLVSVMAANNVTGALQPVRELAEIAHRHGVLFHTDAVQAAGRIPLRVEDLGVDLLSISAHKFHGPQGVGALYIRPGLKLAPIIHGGGQERGLRSATENVAGLAGFGMAAEIAQAEIAVEAARVVTLRERLWEKIESLVPSAYVVGHRYQRLPGHLCLGFRGLEGEAIKLLLALDEAGIMVSTGSACSAHHAGEPSHVLQAMGFDPIRARGSLRVTFGRFTTEEEIDHFVQVLPHALANLRPLVAHRQPNTLQARD